MAGQTSCPLGIDSVQELGLNPTIYRVLLVEQNLMHKGREFEPYSQNHSGYSSPNYQIPDLLVTMLSLPCGTGEHLFPRIAETGVESPLPALQYRPN